MNEITLYHILGDNNIWYVYNNIAKVYAHNGNIHRIIKRITSNGKSYISPLSYIEHRNMMMRNGEIKYVNESTEFGEFMDKFPSYISSKSSHKC